MILIGDCRDVLPGIESDTFDSIVTDPPYELAFMGKQWDRSGVAYDVSMWAECLRVLKPGGHLLAFGGTRTSHRMACAIEDAGFEIRDSLTWIYASGFPKSLDIGKAIDKAAGAERAVIGKAAQWARNATSSSVGMNAAGWTDAPAITAPATDDARKWDGWGTALKPAHEPIFLARKGFAGTVAANVLAHATGGLNIDASRVPGKLDGDPNRFAKTDGGSLNAFSESAPVVRSEGRWPANIVLSHGDCSEDACQPGCPCAELDAQSGQSTSSAQDCRHSALVHNKTVSMGASAADWITRGYNDSGGASRFFNTFRYQAKAPTSERPKIDGMAHPTVKPLALIRWLVTLITPPGGHVLDPFVGSGTTLEACALAGFACTAIEIEPSYLPLIEHRVSRA
jgi:site-specific DNA-methyltransferase (adenine-specific)